jgi:glycosyltransferase involved in cell wall biosynthesis
MKKIHLTGLNSEWVLGKEFTYLEKYFKRFGFKTSQSKFAINSMVYLPARYNIKYSFYHLFGNKVYFDYFHGDPIQNPEFKDIFNYIVNNANKFSKIRITNKKIKQLFINSGLKEKVEIIPLGIDRSDFKVISYEDKLKFKNELGIPQSKIVIGSFQKDGVGWNGGDNPKLIKGPDIFIKVLNRVYKEKKNIFVLLLGPSRNFIKKELSKLNIPHVHIYEKNYLDIYKYYNILDLYLITSRDEGGPKSLLESMTCGVPVVSTPVGQCNDLILNYKNGVICNSFSDEEIYKKTILLIENANLRNVIRHNGFETSKKHDYNNQKKLWQNFFGFKI